MKLTVTKTVTYGRVKFQVSSDGELRHGREYARQTNELGDPLYDHHQSTVFYGDHTFPAPDDAPQLSNSDTAYERAEKLRTRLVLIRQWVEACKAKDLSECGTATIELPEPSQPKRNEKGQFVKS